MPTLLAVPNVSTAGDEEALARLARAFGRGAEVIDFHTGEEQGLAVLAITQSGIPLAGVRAAPIAALPPDEPPTAGNVPYGEAAQKLLLVASILLITASCRCRRETNRAPRARARASSAD